MNNHRLSFLPAIIWWLFTFYLLVLPGSDLPEISWSDRIYLDKWIHIALFAVLVILWSKPFLKKLSASTHVYLIILFAAWLYGIAMEFVQKYFVPLRSFDVIDMLGDGAGCIIGYLFVKYLLRKKLKSQTKNV